MAVRTQIETIISCDGLEGRCPSEAQLRTVVPAVTSISQARKLGWLVEDEVHCPSCSEAPQTATIPVVQTHYPWPTELPGAATARERPNRNTFRHLRLA